MSHSTIVTFRDSKADERHDFGSIYTGSLFIWQCLFDDYMLEEQEQWKNVHEWITDFCRGRANNNFWKLVHRDYIPAFKRAVFAFTFDNAIVERRHFDTFILDLVGFFNHYSNHFCIDCDMGSWIDLIESLDDSVDAVAIHGTSVDPNCWFTECEESDIIIPYDLQSDTKHFEIYERFQL